jgi:large repetitive protein
MRHVSRLLLLSLLVAAVAGVAVPRASALTYLDEICVVESGGVVRVCPQGETGKPYSLQLKGREGCWPGVRFKATGTLPPGISLSSSGLVSGTPTQAGSWETWISMQDIPNWESGGLVWCSDSKSTERIFRFTILQGLQILQRQSTLTAAQLNTPYSLQLSASGATNPSWSVSSGSLPPGVTLSSAGLLAGTPTGTGDFTFKITAAEGSRSDSQTYTVSVVEPLKVTPAVPKSAEVGIAFTYTPATTGGRPGYTFTTDGALPAGFTFDATTGALTGKPTIPGTYAFKLIVTDSLGLTHTDDVNLVVAGKLLITKRPFKAATVGKAYKVTLLARGGVLPRKWTMLGGRPGFLPKGMRLNGRTGVISGTPRTAGTYYLRLQVVDKLGAKSAAPYVLKVNG